MSRIYIPLFVLFLFVIQGIAYAFIPTFVLEQNWLVIAHWPFIFLVLVALFYDLEYTYYSILGAIIIGLMTDIIYTDIIGVYMFIYGVVIYFVHGMRKVLHANFFVTLLLTIVGLTLVDAGVSSVYSFIGINNMLFVNYLLYRLLPTIIANVIALLVFYPMFKNRLSVWSANRFDSKGA